MTRAKERGAHETARRGGCAALPRVETPIVPQSTIAGRALVAVVAIMTFLASLTTGAVMLVRAAAIDWQSDVAREVTIQVRPVAGRDIEADVAQAVAIARAFPGVAEVRPYSKEEAGRSARAVAGHRPAARRSAGAAHDRGADCVRRGARSCAIAQGACRASAGCQPRRPSRLVDRMRAMAGAAVLGGIAVLVLVIAATILSVTFATRAAMATNRPVIEVLHFIGARNSFIAGHFQRHFLRLGLKGGAIGGGGAIALFALAEMSGRWSRSGGGDQIAALFGSLSIGVLGYIAVLAQVVLIAAVTAATSRRTVNRTIETIR